MSSNNAFTKCSENTSEDKGLKFVNCPVCDRVFKEYEIEKHVDKCIFLNTATEGNLKRSSSQFNENEASTSNKKVKVDKDSSLIEIKKDIPETGNQSNTNIPLAEAMRPKNLEDLVGQLNIFGEGSFLHTMLVNKKIPNMILWGPPGCGKTSIANVVAAICKRENSLRFVKVSAVTSNINDVKEAVKVAKNETRFKRQTVLFMDEIHRFNKLQQDTFLPHVENGTITLIGATTENPSFSLNNALLSRCRVVVLSKLSVDDVMTILERAVTNTDRAVIVDEADNTNVKGKTAKYLVERSSLQWIAEVCDGDARVALGALEMALVATHPPHASGPAVIKLEGVKDGIKRTHMLYDRQGEEHYNIISAIQKSIRASDDNAALYWTTRALHAGEDPLYVARRLVRTAAEDIGLGDPNAIVEAVACLQGCQHIGMPESNILLAQCAVRLARCSKNSEAYVAMKRVQRSLTEAKGPLPPVPLHLCNAPTKLMKDLGYGDGYNKEHKSKSGLTYMPSGLESTNFFSQDYDC